MIAQIDAYTKAARKKMVTEALIFVAILLLVPILLRKFLNDLSKSGTIVFGIAVAVFVVVFWLQSIKRTFKMRKNFGLLCQNCKLYLGGKHAEGILHKGNCPKCGRPIFNNE